MADKPPPITLRRNQGTAPTKAPAPKPIPDGYAKAACGHIVEVEGAPGTPAYKGRLQKLAKQVCWKCRYHQDEEFRKKTAEARKLKRLNKPKPTPENSYNPYIFLPIGTVTKSVRNQDGSWTVTVEADGITAEETAPGLMGLATKAFRKWIKLKENPTLDSQPPVG